jgi:hypothetical protein
VHALVDITHVRPEPELAVAFQAGSTVFARFTLVPSPFPSQIFTDASALPITRSGFIVPAKISDGEEFRV